MTNNIILVDWNTLRGKCDNAQQQWVTVFSSGQNNSLDSVCLIIYSNDQQNFTFYYMKEFWLCIMFF